MTIWIILLAIGASLLARSRSQSSRDDQPRNTCGAGGDGGSASDDGGGWGNETHCGSSDSGSCDGGGGDGGGGD